MMWFNDKGYAQRAYVNKVYTQEMSNGGKIKKILLSTSEKKKDSDERIYSSWFVTLAGEARKKDEQKPLDKGDVIKITSIKFSNPSLKQEDGTIKSFLNVTVMDYDMNENVSNPTTSDTGSDFDIF